MASQEDLLRRYQPQLCYDSNEAFFADSAAVYTDSPASVLRRARREDGSPGETIAEPPPAGKLSLELLTHPRYGDGAEFEPGDHLGILDQDYRKQATAMHMRPGYGNVVYGRARLDGTPERRLWLQYWYFYFFNDYHMAGGIGLHEGDWEMVQFRLGDDELPDLAAYCQHRYAEMRRWDEVERQGGSPVVYVARGSHAAYFVPGLHRTEAWFDVADGQRRAPRLRLELLGEDGPPWATWHGRWGDTQPRFAKIDTPSPDGPGPHRQWDDPNALVERQTEDRDHAEPPPAPAVEVRRHRGRLHLDYDFSAIDAWEALPDRLVVTVNSPDERVAPDRRPPETYTFVVDQAASGRILTRRRLEDGKRYDVSVSAVLPTREPSAGKPTASRRLELARVPPFRRPLTGAIELLAGAARRAGALLPWRRSADRAP